VPIPLSSLPLQATFESSVCFSAKFESESQVSRYKVVTSLVEGGSQLGRRGDADGASSYEKGCSKSPTLIRHQTIHLGQTQSPPRPGEKVGSDLAPD